MAVVEIARKAFASYSAIWRLVGLVLLALTLGIMVYSISVARDRFSLMVRYADRRVEFSTALFVVAMFVFARYYRLPISEAERQLAIGFGLYSCVWVKNESLYEGWKESLGPIWYMIQTLAFLASVIVWCKAMRSVAPVPAPARMPELTPEMYARLSEEVDSRLPTLHKRLSHLLGSKDARR